MRGRSCAPVAVSRAGRSLSRRTGRARGLQPALDSRAAELTHRARDHDPESHKLRGFLSALPAHLESGGEGWLILSDLAEHLGLRPRAELLAVFYAAGLKVVDRHDVRPKHPRASDETDPLHAARAAEVISLWRLAVR
jgi:hypothetical protein